MEWFKLTAFLLTVCFNATAQDCSELSKEEKKIVFTTDETSSPYGKFTSQGINHYKGKFLNAENTSLPTKNILKGKKVKIEMPGSSVTEGQPDSFLFCTVMEEGQLYLSGDLQSLRRACKILPEKSYYILKFVDSTCYRYDEPYYTSHEFDDLFMLLRGSIEVENRQNDRKHFVDGDSSLLNKMLNTPIHSIIEYSASDCNMFLRKKRRKPTWNYYPSDELVLPEAEAHSLMQSLRCLAK